MNFSEALGFPFIQFVVTIAGICLGSLVYLWANEHVSIWIRYIDTMRRDVSSLQQQVAHLQGRKQVRLTIIPPPLPPRAATIDASDWLDDDLETEVRS